VTGKGSSRHAASKDVQFNLTRQGDRLPRLQDAARPSRLARQVERRSHDTPYLATGIEADGYSKPYEFGDVLNLDVNATLYNSLARTGSSRCRWTSTTPT
jgi:Ca-activated chloride channel family protein